MCTQLHDNKTGFRADSPRELAAAIGTSNIVWHESYGGLPSVEDPGWMDSCLCPVDIVKTMEAIGGQAHGYGDSGYFDITLPDPTP